MKIIAKLQNHITDDGFGNYVHKLVPEAKIRIALIAFDNDNVSLFSRWKFFNRSIKVQSLSSVY